MRWKCPLRHPATGMDVAGNITFEKIACKDDQSSISVIVVSVGGIAGEEISEWLRRQYAKGDPVARLSKRNDSGLDARMLDSERA